MKKRSIVRTTAKKKIHAKAHITHATKSVGTKKIINHPKKDIKTVKATVVKHKAKNIAKKTQKTRTKKIHNIKHTVNIKKNNIKKVVNVKHVRKKTIRAKKAVDNIKDNNDINIKTPEVKDDSKRVVVVHGWDGDIDKGWFPWIKKELETQGFKVIMERMPSPDRPQIDTWVDALKNSCGNVDERTYFIGHSIGCQAIMRMLEKIESEKIGGAIFLAGWFDLTEHTYTENPKMEKEMRKIAEPWISTRFDLYKVKSKLPPGSVTAIFSEDDPYVDLKNAEAFKEWLDARIIIESGKGHFEEAKISEIPLLIEEILRISKEKKDADQQ